MVQRTMLKAPEEIRNKLDLEEYIHDRAQDYFPSFEGASVQLTNVRNFKRINSELFEYELQAGEKQFGLFVKIPFSRRSDHSLGDAPTEDSVSEAIGPPDADRPRVCPRPKVKNKGLEEYLALKDICDYFGELNDPKFNAIEPLDFFPESQIIIMKKGEAPCFNSLFKQNNRWSRSGFRDLGTAFRNTGSWLQLFHNHPSLPHTNTRHSTSQEVIHSLNEMIDYLESTHSLSRKTIKESRKITELAKVILPTALPTGIGHGDFAPRNVLVDKNDCVTVFDTQSNWRIPIYEDVAHFLIAIKASGPHVALQGTYFKRSLLERYERVFLEGYFQEGGYPVKRVRIFEALRVLEWSASLAFRAQEAKGIKRVVKGGRRIIWIRFLSKYLRKILQDIE